MTPPVSVSIFAHTQINALSPCSRVSASVYIDEREPANCDKSTGALSNSLMPAHTATIGRLSKRRQRSIVCFDV
jgi:hypothetical protein